MRRKRRRRGEGQCQLPVGRARDGAGELAPERNRQRHRPAVAAGPGLGVRAEPVDARQVVRASSRWRRSRRDRSRPRRSRAGFTQPRRQSRASTAPPRSTGFNQRAAGDEPVAGIPSGRSAGRHGCRTSPAAPAGSLRSPPIVERLRRHLPGQRRHDLAGESAPRAPIPKSVGVGVGREHKGVHPDRARGGAHHPAVALAGAVVAPGGAETGLGRLEDDGADAGLGEMQGGGEPVKPAPITTASQRSSPARPGSSGPGGVTACQSDAGGTEPSGLVARDHTAASRARRGLSSVAAQLGQERRPGRVGGEGRVGTVCSTRPVISIM